MNPRKFALFGGIVMLVLGVAALIPALSQMSDYLPSLRINNSYGLFLGYFPMNIVNKLALMIFGIWGIAAASSPGTSLPASITFSRVVFAVMGLLSILGMFPQTNTLFGYLPLFGNVVWEHGLFSLIGAYFGYALSTKADSARTDLIDDVAMKNSVDRNREPQTHGI